MTEKIDSIVGLRKKNFSRTSTIHVPLFLLDTSHVSFYHCVYSMRVAHHHRIIIYSACINQL